MTDLPSSLSLENSRAKKIDFKLSLASDDRRYYRYGTTLDSRSSAKPTITTYQHTSSNTYRCSTATRVIEANPMRSSNRERKQPRRLEDEEPEPLPPTQKPKRPKRKVNQETPSNDTSSSSTKDKGKGKGSKKKKESTSYPKATSNIRKTKQGNSYAIKPKSQSPLAVDISETEIPITTATAPQITKASKKQFRPTKTLLQSLVQIPSHTNRAKIYFHAAKAIAKKEAAALPSHGARPWYCTVTMPDLQGASASSSNFKQASTAGTANEPYAFDLKKVRVKLQQESRRSC